MAQLNFSQLTAPNGAVTDLKNLLFVETYASQSISEIFSVMFGQHNGDKVGLIRSFGMLGKKSQGCNPDYENSLANLEEKVWDIQEWDIPEKLCYKDVEGTLVQYAMKSGVDKANLIDTDYFKGIIEPLLKEEIRKMILRFALFGDKAITSGALKSGSVDNFNMIDGVWKQVFDGEASGKISRTAITANDATTIAAQKSAISTAKTATGILTAVMEDAPLKLQQANNKVIFITQALYNAWIHDVRTNNIGSEGQWESWANGMKAGMIDGVKVVVVPFMDEIIKSNLKNTTNAGALDKPYRVIYTTSDNLLLGTESDGSNFENSLKYGFNEETQSNWVIAKDTLGVMILDNELIHVAY